jgi:hypothetical protein
VQRVLKVTVYLFLVIFGVTAVMTMAGLGYVWFFNGNNKAGLPYLGWLLSILVAEVVGVVVMLGRRGLMYLPDIQVNKDPAETQTFMKNFIAHGSSVTIVSNRLGWLNEAEDLQEAIMARTRAGTRFEIITSQALPLHLREALGAVGVRFSVTGPNDVPEARFTLVNADRSGAERLAIAKGTHPNHEITIFDSNSGPQIIGLAKDIVRKSKALINAAPLG